MVWMAWRAARIVQASRLVYGIETDFQSFDLRLRRSNSAVYPCCATDFYTINQETDAAWLYTLRGRVGVATGNALFYATGGLALTRLSYHILGRQYHVRLPAPNFLL